MSTAVFERRNKQIQDAIDGQNPKQALQLCEKRLKKGEDSPFLRAWKANILFKHTDAAHRERGISEALELCRAKPPVADIDALEMLQNTLGGIDEHAVTASTIWENAAKAKPQELEIQLRWFNLATEKGDWKTAQKAAMSLQSNFPKTRKYYFWAIFMCYLITEGHNTSDTERNLFGALAYRMVSKAAANVPSNPKELLSPARAIQTAEELLLLIRIYEAQGRYDEIATLLNSEHLGVDSRLVQGDWSFVTTKMDALEKADYWEEALAFARELLSIPDDVASNSSAMSYREKDDWRVWSLLLTATQKVEKMGTIKETEDLIAKYVEKCPISRNAQLARLELLQHMVAANSSDPDLLLSECKEYFHRNGKKQHCFFDLRKYISTLEPSLQSAFQRHISQCDSLENGEGKSEDPSAMIMVINELKFKYCFQLSFSNDEESRSQVEDFACRCIRLFRSTNRATVVDSPITIETQPADDLCLLAAMSLIRLHEDPPDAKPYALPSPVLIQAAAILEHLILKSPHNYEALLILTRIYLLLGIGSLALKSFSKLTVKQLQYETVAHNLFTRLSTIHPQLTPPFDGLEPKDTDPQIAMRQALLFYRGSESSVPYARKLGLEQGSYFNVQKSIDFQNSLQNSICRRMWALETRRIQRSVGGPSANQYDHIVSSTAPVVDKRNFDGFTNCERPGQPTFEEHVRVGPLPRAQSVKAMQQTDVLFSFLNGVSSQKKISAEVALPPVELDIDLPETELTPSEIENSKIHAILLKLISSLVTQGKNTKLDDSTSAPVSIDGLASQLESWLTETHSTLSSSSNLPTTLIPLAPHASSPNTSVTSWIYLHTAYSTLETLKAISLFISFASKVKIAPSSTTKLTKDNLTALNELTLSVVDSIKSQTRMLKTHIAESGLLGQLVNLATMGPGFHEEPAKDAKERELSLSKQIEELVEMSSLEMFCGSVMEGWDEALDGVLTVCGTFV